MHLNEIETEEAKKYGGIWRDGKWFKVELCKKS